MKPFGTNEDYCILWCLRNKKEAGNDVPTHNHDLYELVYYVQGDGTTTIGDESHAISAGFFALIPPLTWHNEHHNSEADVICLQFHAPVDMPVIFSSDANRRICRILEEITDELCGRPAQWREMVSCRLMELMLLLHRLQDRKKQRIPKDISLVARYISENFHEKISMTELAAKFNYSSDYLRHRFMEAIGCSPQKYLLDCRIFKACELLRTTDLSCTEIGYRCGFSYSTQFSKIFRDRVGTTPLKYRADSNRTVPTFSYWK